MDTSAELADVLLDELGPMLRWYRDEIGHRLALGSAELTCLELCRRRGWATSSQVGERTGLTRSAVAKLLRRLEVAGHIERYARDDGECEFVMRPHAERDTALDRVRRDVREVLVMALSEPAPCDDDPGVAVVLALRRTSDLLFARARAMRAAAVEQRRLEARRREREAHPVTPWWAR